MTTSAQSGGLSLARVRARASTLLVLLAAGCGGGQDPAEAPRPEPRPAIGAATPDPARVGLEARSAARQVVLERAAARLAELRRLRRSPTVEGALRRALLTRRLTRREHARMRGQLAAARSAIRRLPGLRRLELTAVLRTVEGLAARRELTTERLEPVFLVLRRNTTFWRTAPLPAPGLRTTFARDPAVFQYYAGQGLALQPLASWGKANGLAAACLRSLRAARPDVPCRRRQLTRTLDRLIGLGARRGGYLAWEHYFAYGGGRAPWVSGIVQGTAIQALARGHRALGGTRYARAARRALGAFEAPPPAGVSVRARGGRHYLMYSFSPTLRILNGDLQAVTGLHDAAALLHSRRARRLYRRGERAARASLGGYDTGAWSLYAAQGREATLGYHQLQGGFLAGLCARTGRGAYCAANRRFARYEREPPEIGVRRPRALRAQRATSVTFRLSKLSTVAVRVDGPGGRRLERRAVELPRGVHRFAWTPPARGHYRVRIDARGPSGPPAIERRTVRVVRPDLATERRQRTERRAREARAERRAAARRREAARARARDRAKRRRKAEPSTESSGAGARAGAAGVRARRATASR